MTKGSICPTLGTTLFIVITILVPGAKSGECAWKPIIGIPKPPFGTTETAPAIPNPWNTDTPGYFYVADGGTNAGNGYPGDPRPTIPSPVPAGAVVVVSGKTYSAASFGKVLNVTFNGTSARPAYVRCADYPSRTKVTVRWNIRGSYGVLENLRFGPLDGASNEFGVSLFNPDNPDHIAIRSCEFDGNLKRAGGIVLGSWSYGSVTGSVSHVLVDNCYIHDLGDISGASIKAHGIIVNGSVNHLWVTNSEITRCSGDGIQIEARANREDKIHHVYFGKNKSHDNLQAGMWAKNATDIIFSQNTVHGSRYSVNGGPGDCAGGQYNTPYFWMLFNDIYDCESGIRYASDEGAAANHYFIGNVIHKIHKVSSAYKAGDSWELAAIALWGGTNNYVINNTIWDADAGINSPMQGGTNYIVNNIIGTPSVSGAAQIFMDGKASARSVFANNLLANPTSVKWGGATAIGLGRFKAGNPAISAGTSSTKDVKFVNSAGSDFHLQSNSEAVDHGTASDVYSVFKSRYGIDIAKDFDGISRPQGFAWDIGAYEVLATRPPGSM